MMVTYDIALAETNVLIDVRSPAEYDKGHIPGAVNMPLFDNAERAVVGTIYVQTGRDEAVQRGLDIVGPKLARYVEGARMLSNGMPIVVYCWRGGMRSNSMAWLLSTAGLRVRTLQRGYKGYRAAVLAALTFPWKLHVVGGKTGAGKTTYLRSLAERGEQVIDLEALAEHRGSVFGSLGQRPQPTTEHMMNRMHDVLGHFDPQRTVWVEDESRRIGTVWLPDEFYRRMQTAPVHILDVPLEERVANLERDYGGFSHDELIGAFERVRTKLGGERTTAAIEAVRAHDLATAIRLALQYYDRTYDHCMSKRSTGERP